LASTLGGKKALHDERKEALLERENSSQKWQFIRLKMVSRGGKEIRLNNIKEKEGEGKHHSFSPFSKK